MCVPRTLLLLGALRAVSRLGPYSSAPLSLMSDWLPNRLMADTISPFGLGKRKMWFFFKGHPHGIRTETHGGLSHEMKTLRGGSSELGARAPPAEPAGERVI